MNWLLGCYFSVCKDTNKYYKIFVLDNFYCVNKCQFANIQQVTKHKWETFKKFPICKFSKKKILYLYKLFTIATMSAVLSGIKILPLAAHILIGFHLWHSLCPLEAIALNLLNEVVKNERIGTLGTIFW